ncbi:hypothetical protein ACLOJK_003787 [Asimina triloba]
MDVHNSECGVFNADVDCRRGSLRTCHAVADIADFDEAAVWAVDAIDGSGSGRTQVASMMTREGRGSGGRRWLRRCRRRQASGVVKRPMQALAAAYRWSFAGSRRCDVAAGLKQQAAMDVVAAGQCGERPGSTGLIQALPVTEMMQMGFGEIRRRDGALEENDWYRLCDDR